jgi:hypothetical protein
MTQALPDLQALAERMLRGRMGTLEGAELDAVLSWISGSERAGAGELIHLVGTPHERPGMARRLYDELDAQLFQDGELVLERAGVGPERDEQERRARYRRLMTAFHPDRFPDHGDWMTPRSQAIHKAWRRFRSGEDSTADTPPAPATSPSAKPPRSKRRHHREPELRRSARLVPEQPTPLTTVRLQLAHTPHLAGKLMLAVAVIALVPVGWLYLVNQPYRNVLSVPPTESAVELEPEPVGAVEEAPEPVDAPRPVHIMPEFDAAQLPGELDVWDPDRFRDDSPWFATLPERLLGIHEPPDFETADHVSAPEPVREAPPEVSVESSVESSVEAPAEEAPPADIIVASVAEVDEAPPDSPSVADEAAQVSEPEPAAEPEPVEPEPALEPELARETTPRDEPEAVEPDPPAVEPALAAPVDQGIAVETTQDRITDLLEDYRQSFERGELDQFMASFSASPRENRNQGRRWFRENYEWLFAESSQRQLQLDVLNVERINDNWRVTAQFELEVDWHARRPVKDRRLVQYTVSEAEDGRLLIDAIDY